MVTYKAVITCNNNEICIDRQNHVSNYAQIKLVKNLGEKTLNYCNLIPKAINVLEKVFFGSVSLRPW